jgi:hypothetical protein
VRAAHNSDGDHRPFPSTGDRIELLKPRLGVVQRGTVFYADQLQILVKWDNGSSQNLRPGKDGYRIIGPADAHDQDD